MRSAFSRQMLRITVLIIMVLTILGGVFQVSLTNYMSRQKEASLTAHAEAVAELTRAYAAVGELNSWDYILNLSMATRVGAVDTLICDTRGTVLHCSCQEFACPLVGRVLPDGLLNRIRADGGAYETGMLSGIYTERRYVHGSLIESAYGGILGIVVVSEPAADLNQALNGMFHIFFGASVVVWLAAMLVTFLLSRHEARPLSRMTQTVRRFGHGELSARMPRDRGASRELAELAAAFNNMADSLEKADRRRSEFIANVSHELKTPMTSISGYLDGMLDGTIPPSEHGHYMRIVSDEVRRLSRLVRNMLEISRMQAEGLEESRLSRFDLGELAAQTLLTFEQKISRRHIEVSLLLPERALYTRGNRDSIHQVIYNLVDNAVKFCSDCGVITVSVQPVGGKAHVTVQNTGPVIPAAELPLIFDRFHKLDKSRSRDPGGTGLGLYIVKTIIGAHGEEIWVESHDGITSFTFSMPLVK